MGWALNPLTRVPIRGLVTTDTPALSPWFQTWAFITAETTSLLFYGTQFAVICKCSPGKPARCMDKEGAGARTGRQDPARVSASAGHRRSPYSLVVLPDIWMMHLESRLISRELKGRTRTATFTEAPAISATFVGHSWG